MSINSLAGEVVPPDEAENVKSLAEHRQIINVREAASYGDPTNTPIKLTRIGPITLSQQNFTLGKHSSQTYLTLSTPDAFGDMRAEIIDLRSWLLSDGVDEAVNKAQGLLDQLGTHMQSVMSSRSLKGGS